MGLFDVSCSASGAPLSGAVRTILLIHGPGGPRPCAFPLRGRYDGYGRAAVGAAPFDQLLATATALAVGDACGAAVADFDALLDQVADTVFNAPGNIRLSGLPVSHALYDDRVFEAMAREVARSHDPAFAPYRDAALAARSVEELAALALTGGGPLGEPARTVLALVEPDARPEELRAELASFAQAAAWIRRFAAGRPVADLGQLGRAEHLAAIDAARRALAAHAEIAESLGALRDLHIADWRDAVPEVDDLARVLGDRVGWVPRRPSAPPSIDTAAELQASLVALSSDTAETARSIARLSAALEPEAFRALVLSLEAALDPATAERLAESDGVVAIAPRCAEDLRAFLAATRPEVDTGGPEIRVRGQWRTEIHLVPAGRAPAVADGAAVAAGEILVPGTPNLHARLYILGGQAVLRALAVEVAGRLGAASPPPAEIEALLRPLVQGFVRVVEPNASTFGGGEVVSAEVFAAEIERLAPLDLRPAVATMVLVGLSEVAALRAGRRG
jgi:hypothetical protein